MRTPVLLDGRCPEMRGLDKLGWLSGRSWQAWRTAIRCLLADPLTPADGPEVPALFTQCTDRVTWPMQRHKEAWFLCGRRGGKTSSMAKLAVTLACFTDVTPYLTTAGEVATVMLLASDKRQARIAYRYVVGLLQSDPALADLIVGEPTRERITLSNRVEIEIHTSDFRSTRGYTLLACIADEAAFWSRQHSANPDVEVINAFRPGLGTIPFSLLVGISTVYARRGALYQAFTDHWGKAPNPDHPVLVWKASTRVMNPTFNAAIIAAALASDPQAAKAEYASEFRSDLESFLTHELVTACVDVGCAVRPPDPGLTYYGYVDAAGGGGTKADSMTAGISHPALLNGQLLSVLDLVLEVRPPFNPDAAVAAIAAVCQQYGVQAVEGDLYGGTWPASRFASYGIGYQVAPRPKSAMYLEALPLLASGRARLLDVPRLTHQLLSLERRSGRSGKDVVDHPPGAKDDVANAALGACVLALECAQVQLASAPVELTADDRALERAFVTHMGVVDPVSLHPDFVPPDHIEDEMAENNGFGPTSYA